LDDLTRVCGRGREEQRTFYSTIHSTSKLQFEFHPVSVNLGKIERAKRSDQRARSKRFTRSEKGKVVGESERKITHSKKDETDSTPQVQVYTGQRSSFGRSIARVPYHLNRLNRSFYRSLSPLEGKRCREPVPKAHFQTLKVQPPFLRTPTPSIKILRFGQCVQFLDPEKSISCF